MAQMQQSATQHISIFEQHRIQMQYEIDTIKFDIDDLRRQRSAQSIAGSSRSEGSGDAAIFSRFE